MLNSRVAAWATLLLLFSGLFPQVAWCELRIIGRPDLAVQAAAADVRALFEIDPEQASHSFYIWIRDPSDVELDNVYDFVLNTAVSHAPVLLRADRIRGVAGIILRIDKRRWLPTGSQRENFNFVVNQYFDPNFYVKGEETVGGVESIDFSPTQELLVKQLFSQQHPQLTFKSVGSAQGNRVKVITEPYYQDGNKYTAAWVADFPINAPVASGNIFGPAIQAYAPEDCQDLTTITGMKVPIVEAERWLVHSLRTLEGGMYYKLQGMITKEGKRLTQEEWLKTYGADERLSSSLGGYEYVGMWHSAVTAKPRRAAFFYGVNMRPSVGAPLIVVTQDNLDETLDVGLHPMYSLLDAKFDATEILATKPNGMIGYGLFNGNGVLQDSAPDNLVKDHTIPRPYTSRLEPAISCIRCHAPHDQWQPMKNQVQTLLGEMSADGQQITAIGDSADPSMDVVELNTKLAQLYSGNIEGALQLARDGFEKSCAKLTSTPRPEADHAKWMANVVAERFARERYQLIDPQEALRTLGVVVSEEKAVETFRSIVPTVGNNEGPKLFDAALLSLRMHDRDAQMSLLRSDWERVYQATLAYAVTNGVFPKPEPPAAIKEEEDAQESN